MVLTVTLNPAIDTNYEVNNFSLGKVNRVDKILKTPGGKGLNVSKVLKSLSIDVTATGFLGGENGRFIERSLDKMGIIPEFSHIHEETRVCIAVISENGITEILERGPKISREELKDFYEKFSEVVRGCDTVSISGSLPLDLSTEVYGELIKISKKYGKNVFLDTSGDALKDSLKYKPYFIKPNLDELEYLLGKSCQDVETAIQYGENLFSTGIENVLITLGREGAIFINSSGVYRGEVPKVDTKNTVGSGDSTVAGFIYGYELGLTVEETLKTALACGTSNAMLEATGEIDLSQVELLKNQITIKKIK